MKTGECQGHVYHLFVIQTEARDALQTHLQAVGIGKAVHYPQPVHRQPAYRHLGYVAGSLTVTETTATHILSLPMYPAMPPEQVTAVAEAIHEFLHQRM